MADLIGFAGTGLMILAIGNTILLPGFEKIKKYKRSYTKVSKMEPESKLFDHIVVHFNVSAFPNYTKT